MYPIVCEVFGALEAISVGKPKSSKDILQLLPFDTGTTSISPARETDPLRGVMLLTVETIIIVLVGTEVLDGLSKVDEYYETVSRVQDFGLFSLELSLIFVFLTLVDVALGILHCWGAINKGRSALQSASYGFGLMRIIFAITILARWETPLSYGRFAAILLLVASILSFVRSTWSVAQDAIWILPMDYTPGTYDLILDAALGSWTQFTALILLFFIGHKKLGGLWSASHSFLPGNQHYAYNGQLKMQQLYAQQYGRPNTHSRSSLNKTIHVAASRHECLEPDHSTTRWKGRNRYLAATGDCPADFQGSRAD
ncbi:hypothetical protein BJ170DRAFT_737592 [Xylariales sp. AK1849]|nr:hypothetical protein BJ170DRAFT_737592 [Xylariales sp. AK1849]